MSQKAQETFSSQHPLSQVNETITAVTKIFSTASQRHLPSRSKLVSNRFHAVQDAFQQLQTQLVKDDALSPLEQRQLLEAIGKNYNDLESQITPKEKTGILSKMIRLRINLDNLSDEKARQNNNNPQSAQDIAANDDNIHEEKINWDKITIAPLL